MLNHTFFDKTVKIGYIIVEPAVQQKAGSTSEVLGSTNEVLGSTIELLGSNNKKSGSTIWR